MDKTDALNIAQRYAGAVKANYSFSRIILFGSYAKGNFNEDSDIDKSNGMSKLVEVSILMYL